MMSGYFEKARDFIEKETQFHLGFLPSEASNPLTENLDKEFEASSACGARCLFSCDAALVPFLRRALASQEFDKLRQAVQHSFENGGRLILSGCGATGRISILMEAMWRDYLPGDERVVALMTGGDLALARAVENFEDYPAGGARQCQELQVNDKDTLIGITATGETASIIGTAMEASRRGAQVFMLICVPKELPMSRLERCRELYERPNVTVLSMPIGGMAISGSTRMQSSTIEMLVACAAMESAIGADTSSYPEKLEQLVSSLMTKESLEALGEVIDFESGIYKHKGLIDYYPGDYLLDVLNDTTERPPTFKIPSFVSRGEALLPQPWAFVRDADHSTEEAWLRCFRRHPRCIGWTAEDYAQMGLTEQLTARGIPQLNAERLYSIGIGNEPLSERASAEKVFISVADSGRVTFDLPETSCTVNAIAGKTPLAVFRHIGLKLVMNVLSSGVMVKMGRVKGNWMTHLALSNKKLIDRATRIVASLCHLSYEQACIEIFRSMEEIGDKNDIPVVNYTLERLRHE